MQYHLLYKIMTAYISHSNACHRHSQAKLYNTCNDMTHAEFSRRERIGFLVMFSLQSVTVPV